ncbi:MAG: thioredoxin domain-containing protein, partial [Calditrichia bacterium]
MSSEGKKYNHLKNEKSPYLLQHAGNPVDWYPWGEEAFEKARKEDKPIFLSIGYATCHWCHVMEHESFEDEDVARLLNETFVCIKVDREERPDVDDVYMTVCQMMTGSGGWPLTIMMTPDKKPFFAGTYIPKESRYGRMGLVQLIPRVQELWETQRQELLNSAEKVSSALSQHSQPAPGSKLSEKFLKEAYQQFNSSYDEKYGGFGSAPKFPTAHNLMFLLRYWKRSANEKALNMVENTLRKIRLGGVYDHIGFGFHRYSTDREWLLPHFEKMLYDQAILSMAYSETYQATGNKFYRRVAEEIFTYVLRDMTDPKGGFYSAEDADSEGEEGKFYVWSEEEIKQILNEDEADLIINVFNVKKEGNFQEQTTREKTGTNILHLKKPLA